MIRSFLRGTPAAVKGTKTPPIETTIPRAWIFAGLAVTILVSGVTLGIILTKKTVTLADGGKEAVVKTRAGSVGELLAEKNVQLGPHDRVVPDSSAKIADKSRVEIKRAHRITLKADRENVEFYSPADTVGDVLGEKKVALNTGDILKPAAGERITGDTEIQVIRVVNKTEVETAPIPFDVRRVPNPEMSRGISRTVSRGQNGEERKTWNVTYHDGQEVGRDLVDRQVTAEPADAVIQVGTGQMVSRGGETIRFREAMDVVATAYTHTGYNTFTGVRPVYGVVAVDPRVIPLGTKIYVEGYGHATALDTGGAIKGNRIDVFLESAAEACRWGIRTVRIYLVD